MRSNTCDSLPQAVENLRSKIAEHGNILDKMLRKAECDKSDIDSAIIQFDEIKDTADDIYTIYLSLMNDFDFWIFFEKQSNNFPMD